MLKQNVTELRKVGSSLVEGVKAVSDGLDLSDIGAVQNVGLAIMQAADDVKVDLTSALEEIGSEILREAARMRREEKGIEAVE